MDDPLPESNKGAPQRPMFDSARIKTTPPPGAAWCVWCNDRTSDGMLVLVDDTGVPIENPQTPASGHPMCGICGWRFHGSESEKHAGTYVYDPEDQR